MRVLDVGCGPGRHAHARVAWGRGRGPRHLRRLPGAAGRDRGCGRRRRLPFPRTASTRPSRCARAASGCWAGHDDAGVLVEMARVVRPDGGRSPSRPSRPTSRCGTWRRARPSMRTGVNHERTSVLSPMGDAAEFDLWTTCFTPRELRLMAAAAGAARDRPVGGHARGVRPQRAGREPPGVSAGRRRCRIVACGERFAASLLHDQIGGRFCPERRLRLHVRSRPTTPPRWAPSTKRVSTPPAKSSPTTSAARPSRTPSPAPSSSSRTETSSSGTVVKVDKDEVLLDIGFKSEGVIPARELSIRHDVDPHEIVSHGRQDRGPGPPEGGQGRPADPLQEAGPVRAGLGDDRGNQGAGRCGARARSSRSSRAA